MSHGLARFGLACKIADLQIALGREDRIPGFYRPEQAAAARERLAQLAAEFNDLCPVATVDQP